MGTVSYYIHPKGMPKYYYTGWTQLCVTSKEAALKYVSLTVARTAAKLVTERLRREFPLCRSFVAKKLLDGAII